MASLSGYVVEARMPPNFSWVIDGLLAALAYPRDEHHYVYLRQQEVDYLVSLTEKQAPTSRGHTEIEVLHIGMPDFTPPSLQQVDEFIQLVEKAKLDGKRLAVHCYMGRGRTGTMLACYLVHDQRISAKDAIRKIRFMRPGSIETSEQEELVSKFEKHFKGK